jgi:hypothetical protein
MVLFQNFPFISLSFSDFNIFLFKWKIKFLNSAYFLVFWREIRKGDIMYHNLERGEEPVEVKLSYWPYSGDYLLSNKESQSCVFINDTVSRVGKYLATAQKRINLVCEDSVSEDSQRMLKAIVKERNDSLEFRLKPSEEKEL